MRRRVHLIIYILLSVSLYAQEYGQREMMRVPFDFPLYLSGNFGELRSNHFHGGVDFKTQGVEGKPIHCPADGYISRVSVSPGGYGNAVYITHDNGYTTVHGHLKAFSREVAEVIKAHQYAHEMFAVDTTFEAGRFPLRKGEVFALAGNSGYSFGPHLHMEVRETATNEPVDPLLFYMDKIKDTTPPRATGVMLYPQQGRGVVEQGTEKRAFDFPGGAKNLAKPVTAWGQIGVGISANDYMDGTRNRYGVQTVVLLVDGVELFHSTVDRFLFTENRMINSWTDYPEYVRTGRWYMKSFIAPGNPLRILHAGESRGVVDICEERDYHFEYRLSDLYGNTSRYHFTVRGRAQEIPVNTPPAGEWLRWDTANFVSRPFMELDLPKGVLYEDAPLQVKVSHPGDSLPLSLVYQIGDEPLPLHDYATLRIGLLELPVDDMAKYYVASRRGKWQGSMGGVYNEGGWLTARIRDLGATYFVAIDTIAPVIEPLGTPAQWQKSGTVTLKIKDNASGINTWRATLDGEFVLMAYSSKNARLTCRLSETPVVRKNALRTLRVVLTDRCGNQVEREWKVRY